jgi:hypothetical protein
MLCGNPSCLRLSFGATYLYPVLIVTVLIVINNLTLIAYGGA